MLLEPNAYQQKSYLLRALAYPFLLLFLLLVNTTLLLTGFVYNLIRLFSNQQLAGLTRIHQILVHQRFNLVACLQSLDISYQPPEANGQTGKIEALKGIFAWTVLVPLHLNYLILASISIVMRLAKRMGKRSTRDVKDWQIKALEDLNHSYFRMLGGSGTFFRSMDHPLILGFSFFVLGMLLFRPTYIMRGLLGDVLGYGLGVLFVSLLMIHIIPHVMGNPFTGSPAKQMGITVIDKTSVMLGLLYSMLFTLVLYGFMWLSIRDSSFGYQLVHPDLGANFAIALVPGVLEEIIFRGYLFVILRDRHGADKAIVYSAIFFSLAHLVNLLIATYPLLTLIQLLYTLIIGLVFAMMLDKTGSLWGPILIHYLIDAVGFGVQIDGKLFDEAPLPKFILEELGWVVAGIAMLIPTIVWYRNDQ